MNYTKNIDLNNAKSSGILFQYPYFIDNNGNTVYFQNSVWRKNYNIKEPHIGYSQVAEVRSDGSYIINEFSNYQNNPDIFENVKFDNVII
jgi:hypothetical protein